MPKNIQTTAQLHSSQASKVMLKILQARLQQYVNHELPDGQAGFRKGRGTRDQIASICWIMEKGRVPEKHLLIGDLSSSCIYFQWYLVLHLASVKDVDSGILLFIFVC